MICFLCTHSVERFYHKQTFSSVQSLNRVRLFATPWITARQASLSITNFWSSLRLTPSSQWCHPAISSSVVPLSSCPQSLQASDSFPMSQLSCTGIVKITADGDCSHEIKKTLAPWKETYDKPRQSIKKERQHFGNKGLHSQSYGFSSSHVRTWELDHNEGWGLTMFKRCCSEDSESPLDSKEIKPVNPKGNQPWIFIEVFLFFLSLFIGRTDAVAPILWPPDAKNWLIGKDSDAGKDWRQKEKGTGED